MTFLRDYDKYFPLDSASFVLLERDSFSRYTTVFHAKEKGANPPHLLTGLSVVGLSYVLTGIGELRLNDGTCFHLRSGSGFVIDPRTFSSLYASPDERWSECSLALPLESLLSFQSLGCFREPGVVSNMGLDPLLVEAYHRCHLTIKTANNNSQAVHDVVDAVINVMRARDRAIASGTRGFVDSAKALLAESCTRRDAVASVAGELGMGYHQFRKRFADLTGDPPRAWQIRYRVSKAHDLLRKHDIETVAEMLGYSDRFVFSRQFRKVTGVSPGKAKKQPWG